MSRRTFIQAFIVALVLLAGLNFAIGRLGRRAVPRVLVRQIHATQGMTHVFLGNSIVEAGFDPKSFAAATAQRGTETHPFNAGLGWSTSAEHAILWEQIRATGNRPKVVFYGFFDFLLHEEYSRDPWWGLAGNVAMAYYVDPVLAGHYHAPDSLIGRIFMRAVAPLALFTERSTFWGKVERMRRWLSAQGMRAESTTAATAEPQDAFRAFEAADGDAFQRRSQEIILRDEPFNPAIRDLIASAQKSGAEVCFVEMPMTPVHRRKFYSQPAWEDYKRYLKARLATTGVRLIEASDWVPETTAFADSLHLNQIGAQQFSARLGRGAVGAPLSPAP